VAAEGLQLLVHQGVFQGQRRLVGKRSSGTGAFSVIRVWLMKLSRKFPQHLIPERRGNDGKGFHIQNADQAQD
jgi:hypothetical protein